MISSHRFAVFAPGLLRARLLTVTVLMGTTLMAGCLGNPPERPGARTRPIPPDPSASQALEAKTIRLGYLPILEAAPLVVGVEKGFFARHGLKVLLAKQASWPAARDNVVLGSAGGGIDGGQWQQPMPHLLSEGIISNGRKLPMAVLAQLMSQGNAIAVSGSQLGADLGLDLKPKADVFRRFPLQEGRRFRAAYTFPNANQDLWLRYWLAAGGVDPDRDVELLTVPTSETLQGMRNGTMEAFSTGDPWPSRIVRDNIGYLAALTAQIWPAHPEEVLAVRADWVASHPKSTQALLKGLIEAQQWMDQPANRAEVARIIGSRAYYNTPEAVLKPALQGQYRLGASKQAVNDPALAPLYWSSSRGTISYPYKGLSLWFLVESLRWNLHPGKLSTIAQARALVDRVNREDLWRQAARSLGVKGIPTGSSRGPERFFDGKVFDPANPQAYLDSLQIKRN